MDPTRQASPDAQLHSSRHPRLDADKGAVNSQTIVVSDWEGPWAMADFAVYLMQKYVPNGNALFNVLSNYSLRRAERGEGQPGDTLRFIAPFLFAYGVGQEKLTEALNDPENLKFIGDPKEAIAALKTFARLYVVSTSYSQYVSSTAESVGISADHTISTKLPIHFTVEEKDKAMARKMAETILKIPKLGLDDSQADGIVDTFFGVLSGNSFGPLLSAVTPVGGDRKFDALQQVLQKERGDILHTAFIGDSSTDAAALRRTAESGGLSFSVNGNKAAVENASYALLTKSGYGTVAVFWLFNKGGLSLVDEVVGEWGITALRQNIGGDPTGDKLLHEMLRLDAHEDLPAITKVDKGDETALAALVSKSNAFKDMMRVNIP